jgi:TorA maturation chaperone TorD
MALSDNDNDRAESYRLLADLFYGPPDAERIRTIQEEFGLESRETEEDIIPDFDHLFRLDKGRVPPVESFHSEGTNAPDTVMDSYLDAGLTFDEEYETVPDHISLEFLFMGYLIDTDNRRLQQKFLEEHIANWVPYYCEQVMQEAKTLFYREIAGITKDFVESEYEGLG